MYVESPKQHSYESRKAESKKKVIPFLLGIQSKLNFSYHLVSTNSVEFLDVYVVYQNSYIFSL